MNTIIQCSYVSQCVSKAWVISRLEAHNVRERGSETNTNRERASGMNHYYGEGDIVPALITRHSLFCSYL